MSTKQNRREIYSTRRWRNLRGRMLEDKGWLCEECGNAMPENYLEVHHIIPVGKCADPFDESNLSVLCRRCHGNHHAASPERAAWNQLLKTEIEEHRK